LNNLALVVQQEGRHREAEDLSNNAWMHLKITLGENHPSALGSMGESVYM